MTRLTIIGLPITNATIRKEFIEFLSKDNIIIFNIGNINNKEQIYQQGDYENAQAGFDSLIDIGFTFCDIKNYDGTPRTIISVDLWDSISGRNTPEVVADRLLIVIQQFMESYPEYQCVYITPGSPLYGDRVCSRLIDTVECDVIDTDSSADIIRNICETTYGVNYEYTLVHRNQPSILFQETIHILYGMASSYGSVDKNWINDIFDQIDEEDIMFSCCVKENPIIIEYDKNSLKHILCNEFISHNVSFVIIKGS